VSTHARTRIPCVRTLAYAWVAALVLAAVGALAQPQLARATNFTASPNAVNVLGPPSFTAAMDAPRLDRSLHFPEGVSIDGSGRLYIADSRNSRVVGYGAVPTTDGAPFGFAVGLGSTSDYLASCSATRSDWSVGVSGGGGRLAVADRWIPRVMLHNTAPTTSGAAANVVLGQTSMTTCPWTNGGPTSSTFHINIGDVWTDGTRVVVSDTGHNRVLIWNSWPTTNGQAANLVLGQPDFTSSAANNGGVSASRMSSPFGVWSNGTRLLVADRANNRVLVWNSWPTTNGQAANLVLGQTGMTATGNACSASGLSGPDRVTSNGTRIAISDRWNTRVVLHDAWPTANGAAAARALGQTSLTGCVGPVSKAVIDASSLSEPSGVSLSAAGTTLAVTDTDSHRILVWTAWPTANGQAANRVIGQATMAQAGMNNQQLETFVDMRIEPRVRIDQDNAWPFQAPSGQLWLAAANRISRYAGNPATINEAPTLQLGQTNNAYSFGRRPNWTMDGAQLRHVQQIWTNGTRFLAVDGGNHRVLVWNSYPSSMNQPADLVLGQPTLSGASSATTASGMNSPVGVASDGTRIAVSDYGNNRILVWNSWPTSNGVAANVVLGQPGFTTGTANNGGVSATSLSGPVGIAMADGKLAVADSFNNRILIWHRFPTRNASPADAAVGQWTFTTSAASMVSSPKSVSLEDNTLTYTGNCQIRYLDPIPLKSTDTGAVDLTPGCGSGSPTQDNVRQPMGVSLRSGVMWVADQGHGRLLRFDDVTVPTITVAPVVTSECSRQVVTWTTSESGTSEVHWGPTSQATPAGYPNHEVSTAIAGPRHRVVLTTAVANTTYFYRVQTRDGAGNTVTSTEGTFVQRRCPAAQFAGRVGAQSGSANPTDLWTATPRMSWRNDSLLSTDRQRVQVLSTPLDDVEGLYRMDATPTADASGLGRSLTFGAGASAPTSVTGAPGFGQALRFDGDDAVRTPLGADLDMGTFTVEARVRTSSIANAPWPSVLTKDDGNGMNRNFAIWFDRDCACPGPRLVADLSIDGVRFAATAPASLVVDGQWHHVAATHDGSTLSLLVDGVVVGSVAAVGQADLRGDRVVIGGVGLPAFTGFVGDIDEVRLSSVPRSAAEVLGHVRSGVPHATVMWDSDTTDAGVAMASCASGARCADVVYGATGTAAALALNGARYHVRSKFRASGAGAWSAWSGWDWFQTSAVPSVTVAVDTPNVTTGAVGGQDSVAAVSITVETTNSGGYQLTATDPNDSWGATAGGATIPDWTGTGAVPSTWAAGASGYVGASIISATGGRLAKWGTAGSWPATDYVNNRFAGLKATTPALLHERLSATTGAGDEVRLALRANPPAAQAPGAYVATVTLTTVAIP
jgi:hypothetical protein